MLHMYDIKSEWTFFQLFSPIKIIGITPRSTPLKSVLYTKEPYTVKPVYNDHLMGYFSAF